jgi:adenine-specific DNA-methyltransferase
MDKMRMESIDMTAQNVEKIGALFPNCITETKDEAGKPKKAINFDLLRQMLSGDVIEGDEAYEFTWVGKKAAIVEANKPIRKTLRPCPEESVNWDSTENLYIEGDNLEVLKLLQESYLGKVKMIYIDPPYNTGNDFIYRDDFAMKSEEWSVESGEIDADGKRLFINSDSNGRFHSDWCSMIYSRLMLARNLMAENGVIFISIDDKESSNLKKICDGIFGYSNFVANLIWQSTAGSNTGTDIVTVTENILVYTKSRCSFTFDGMIASDQSYALSDEYESVRGKYALDKLDRRRVAGHYSEALNYGITMPDGTVRYPGGGKQKSTEGWNYLWSKTKVEWGIENGFIEFKKTNGEWSVYNKRYAKMDNEGKLVERTIPFRNLITSDQCNTAQGTAELRSLFDFRPFDFPKPSGLIKQLLLTAVRTDKNALVMDFFSGSATTAHAVMQLNAEDGGHRKFIMVQLPELCDEKSEAYKAGYPNICEIGKERIRRAGKKILAELAEEDNSTLHSPNSTLDVGFRVLKLDDTNMKDVYYAPADYEQSMLSMLESNIKDDRTDLDLLFGCLLEWGLPLSLPYKSEKIDGCTVHNYNDGDLIACFDENIPDSVIKAIARMQPLRAVFRDSSFASSPAKINVEEIFKLMAPDTSVKVI